MRRYAALFLCGLFISSWSCSRDFAPVAPRQNPPGRPLTTQEAGLSQSSNEFGWRLLKRIAAEHDQQNTFISPLSVTLALAMAYNGAGGETETAMRTTLGFSGYSRDELNTALSGLSSMLMSLDWSVQFRIANAIWYRQGVQVKPDFICVGGSGTLVTQ
ncbi:MAG TPA: serpin family protein, partial [bacterium]|nr:serpin family protein [bacterium]